MTVPAKVVAVADPLPSTHARMPRGRIAFTSSVPLLYVTDSLPAPLTPVNVGSPACASKPYWVGPTPAPATTLISPEATTIALPLPRLSACMPPPSIPVVEIRCGPLQVTLASRRGPTLFVWGCANANIAQVLSVPATSIVVFVALMMAAPLDCIRSPVTLLLPGNAVLLMITGFAPVPFAAIEMSALFRVGTTQLAALTALTLGKGGVTTTPGSSAMLIGCGGPAKTLMLGYMPDE